MDADPAPVADSEATEAAHPGRCALDDPPVPAPLPAALASSADEPGFDVATAAASRQRGWSEALSSCTLSGLRLGRNGRDRAEQILEWQLSWTLALVSRKASGMPRRSVMVRGSAP
jgi:hypothetical protein